MNNDTIYRQAAIDEFKSYGERVDTATQLWTIIGCADMIRNLPPAEPETCDGCKHKGKWENEVEYGYDSPCTFCKRRANDNYER